MVALLSILCLFLAIARVQSQGMMFRSGFQSNTEKEFRDSAQLSPTKNIGMSPLMSLVVENDWQIHPLGFSGVKDRALRRHLHKYLREPIKLKLSSKLGKHGYRAIGITEDSGRTLRAYWRESAPVGGASIRSGNMPYDEAVRKTLSSVEFEIQLPPLKKKAAGLPTVICTVSIEAGNMNKQGVVPRGCGQVKVLPNGRSSSGSTETLDTGKAFIGIPMRAGLVDHSWARGRKIFRRGRPTGFL